MINFTFLQDIVRSIKLPKCNIENCEKESTEIWYDGQFMVYACKKHEKQYKGKGEVPYSKDVLLARNTKYWESLHD